MKHLAAVCIAIALATTTVTFGGGVELGSAYRDRARGYSLRSPVGSEFVSEADSGELAAWLVGDPVTGEALWRFSVQSAFEKNMQFDLKEYSKLLADKLRAQESFDIDIDSVKIVRVAGKDAIDLSGPTRGLSRQWRREVWVQRDPGKFLVFKIVGATDEKAELRKASDSILATVRFWNPAADIAARKDNLKRGRGILAELTEDKLIAALRKKPRWYLMRYEGKTVGFMRFAEASSLNRSVRGVEVKVLAVIAPAGGEMRIVKQTQFTTADQGLERSRKTIRINTKRGSSVTEEDIFKQGDLVMCSISPGDRRKQKTSNKRVPAAIAGSYLSRAMITIMPRLLELDRPQTYAFASYNVQANSFDVYSLEVKGYERIKLNSRTVEAVRVVETPAENSDSVDLWLDAKGVLLRSRLAGGLVIEKAPQAEVLIHFPDAIRLASPDNTFKQTPK